MSLGIGTVQEVLSVIQAAVEIYKNVEGVPATVEKLGRRIQRLGGLLGHLEEHMCAHKKHALVRLRPGQRADLTQIMKDTRVACDKVRDIFDKLQRQIGPLDLELRHKWVAQFWFAYGPSSEAVAELTSDIDIYHREIDSYLGLMGAQFGLQNQQAIKVVQEQGKVLQKQVEAIQAMLVKKEEETQAQAQLSAEAAAQIKELQDSLAKARKQVRDKERQLEREKARAAAAKEKNDKEEAGGKAQEGGEGPKQDPPKKGEDAKAKADPPKPATIVVPKIEQPSEKAKTKDGVNKPRPSPSPSPLPPRDDYSVLFVDPQNIGRSNIAQAITALLSYQTKAAGAVFRIRKVDSAGFFVRDNSECVQEIEGLDFAHSSYKMDMVKGGRKTDKTGCDALFDNSAYASLGTVRDGLEAELRNRVSKGIKRNVFREFDYIVCFTGREHDNLIKLRDALVAKDGKTARAKGKGRILHLGRYLSADGIPKEIITVKNLGDDKVYREQWNRKVAQLKTAVKGFLRQELQWSLPETDAAAKQ